MCGMNQCVKKKVLGTAVAVLLPLLSHAQGFGDSINGLNGELEKLFNQMMPLCSHLIDVGRAIAGFGALWFIALRVWKHIARAEAIDFYPLLRPFALGMAILAFPALINLMNGILAPTVNATADMASGSNDAITWHIQ